MKYGIERNRNGSRLDYDLIYDIHKSVFTKVEINNAWKVYDSIYLSIYLQGVLKIIKIEVEFTKTEMNNEWRFCFCFVFVFFGGGQIVPLTFNTLIPANFRLIKGNSSSYDMVWSYTIVFLMSPTSSNIPLEMYFQFKEQENITQRSICWVLRVQYLQNSGIFLKLLFHRCQD